MTHYHHIKSLADEERLLKEIIDLETQIHAQKERQRLKKNSQNEKFAQIFEPITKTMQSLAQVASHDPTEDLITFEPTTDPPKEVPEPLKDEPEEIDLYSKALHKIPKKFRDDGVFGLDPGRKLVSGRPYSVEGNLLIVENEDGTQSKIQIQDPNVWTILLAQNPAKIIDLTDEKGQEAVRTYRDIVEQLGLIPRVQFTNKNFKKRMKYKLLSPSKGTGFLFSVRKPSFMNSNGKFKPSTLIIPSDRKGLLRALLQAVAELRAGNESMRNLVVPLAQEAKRKKILPNNLLSPEEMTWVYA